MARKTRGPVSEVMTATANDAQLPTTVNGHQCPVIVWMWSKIANGMQVKEIVEVKSEILIKYQISRRCRMHILNKWHFAFNYIMWRKIYILNVPLHDFIRNKLISRLVRRMNLQRTYLERVCVPNNSRCLRKTRSYTLRNAFYVSVSPGSKCFPFHFVLKQLRSGQDKAIVCLS
jgi:hypothetical protein